MTRTRLKKVSNKQAAINRSLALLVRDYLEAHPQCEFMITDEEWESKVGGDGLVQCPRPSTHVHHIRGRGKHTLDVTTFMAVCGYHHPWYIHFFRPKEAREKGYLK